MKFKTTKKAVMNGYPKVYAIGYCGLQYLMYDKQPAAYTCGIYGWNADIYDFDNIALVMGYRPFGKDTRNKNSLGLSYVDYEEKARKIVNDTRLSWNKRMEKVETLRNEFINMLSTIG